jgi:serine/threonine protein kinase/tetratricopeptide (TPR) repeat protein
MAANRPVLGGGQRSGFEGMKPVHCADIESTAQRFTIPSLRAMLPSVTTVVEISQPALPNIRNLTLPAVLGAFRLEREIGRGATGTVYAGANLESGAPIAIKVLHDSQTEHVALFKAETRRVADIMHRNLLVPYELVNIGDLWFFSMDLIVGQDLVSFVREAGSSAERMQRLRSVFTQLVSAVSALHQNRLVHLDLKPANVLVDTLGQVFVLDFGLARPLDEAAALRGRFGTPGYWAPEQASGQRKLPASDCYAIGVMLYEALTGMLPESLWETGVIEAPLWLSQTVVQLLAQEPERRPTIGELLRVFSESEPEFSARRQSAFVGRRAQLDLLHQSMTLAKGHASRLIVVRGPSGIGKTALVTCFLEQIQKRDPSALILHGRCYERETVPYKGFDMAIERLANMLDGWPDAKRNALHEWGVELAGEIFPRLRLTFRTIQRPADDPIALRTRATRAIKTLFERLAEVAPVILCIDDMQWADKDTAALFAEMLANFSSKGLLVLWTCRSAEPRSMAFFDEWVRHESSFPSSYLELGGLEQEEALELARSMLQTEHDRAPAVARAAAGNPFLLEQIAFHAGVSASGGDLLTLLVRDRLRAVSGHARKLAVIAAMAGRPLSQLVLFQALAGVSAADAHRALAELRRQVLIHTHGPRLEDSVEAWHDQISQIALQALTPIEKKELRLALAQALEANGSGPAELADHYGAAGETKRALRYYTAAAIEAREALAFDRAAQYYVAALDASDLDPKQRAELEAAAAEALFNAGRCSEAALRFDSALSGAAGEANERLALRASEAWLLSGHVENGLAVLAPVLAKRRLSVRRGWRAVVAIARQLVWLVTSGEVLLSRKRLPATPQLKFEADVSWSAAKGLIYVSPLEGTDFLLRSLGAAIQGGHRPDMARALGFLGAGMFMQFPLLENRGRRYLSLAGEIAQESNDPYLLAMREVWRGFSEVYPGRWEAMLEHSQRGLQMLESSCVGVAWESVVAQGVCAWAHQFLGDLKQSASFASGGLAVAQQRGDLFAEVMFSHYLAYTELAAGRLDDVRRRIEAVEERWQPSRYTVQHFYSTYLLAMLDLCDSKPLSAAEKLAACRKPFLQAGGGRAPMSRIDYALIEARIALTLDLAEAKQLGLRPLRTIAAELRSERRSDGVGHAAFVLAADASKRGDVVAAETGWRKAVNAYRLSGMVLHEGCARFRLGEVTADAATMHDAEAQIAHCGVTSPEAWLPAFMPSGSLS